MSFEDRLFADMRNESEHVSVRQAATLARNVLIDRVDIPGAAALIDADKEVTPDLKKADKRHKLTKHMEKSRALDAAIAQAAADVKPPPLLQAESIGQAMFDSQLVANFSKLPKEQQESLLKNSPDTRLAIARSPRELTGLIEQVHEGLRDQIRREKFPDAMAQYDADMRVLKAAKIARDVHRETARATFGLAIETHATVITPSAA